MSTTTIYTCLVCESPLPWYEPQYCCSGRDCGCHGAPIDPPICGDCWGELMARRPKPAITIRADWHQDPREIGVLLLHLIDGCNNTDEIKDAVRFVCSEPSSYTDEYIAAKVAEGRGDYRQHVRSGGKLTFEEFKARKKKKYRDRGIRILDEQRDLRKQLKRERKSK